MLTEEQVRLAEEILATRLSETEERFLVVPARLFEALVLEVKSLLCEQVKRLTQLRAGKVTIGTAFPPDGVDQAYDIRSGKIVHRPACEFDEEETR